MTLKMYGISAIVLTSCLLAGCGDASAVLMPHESGVRLISETQGTEARAHMREQLVRLSERAGGGHTATRDWDGLFRELEIFPDDPRAASQGFQPLDHAENSIYNFWTGAFQGYFSVNTNLDYHGASGSISHYGQINYFGSNVNFSATSSNGTYSYSTDWSVNCQDPYDYSVAATHDVTFDEGAPSTEKAYSGDTGPCGITKD